MKKLLIDLPDPTLRRLEQIAMREHRSVKSWIEYLVIQVVSHKPIDGKKQDPASWVPSRETMLKAARELNVVLRLKPRISNNWRNEMIIEKLKEAEKNIDWNVDYISEETINTLKDIIS